MATIQNERDKLLQAAAVRFIPPFVDPDLIPGYNDALDDISELQDTVGHLLNTSANFAIRASAMTFMGSTGSTTPPTITLTAVRGEGLDGGTVQWSVFAGSATLSPATGEATTITGSTVTGYSVTIRARLTVESKVHDAYVTLTRLGGIAAEDVVDLSSQVTGSLASGNVSGLGALALLNVVDLNTQVTGALNGQTQVTNLGNLAYVNGLAANQIGAGTFAAGVVYAGDIYFDKMQGGAATFTNFGGTVSIGVADSGLGVRRTTATSYNTSCVVVSDANNGTNDNWPLWVNATRRSRSAYFTGAATSGTWDFNHPVVKIHGFGAGTIAVTLDVHSQHATAVAAQIRNTGAGTQGNIGASGHAFYAAAGTYGPFTGSHEAAIDRDSEAQQGDIMVDADLLHSDSLIDTFFRIERATQAGERGAIGVLTRKQPFGDVHIPAAFIWPDGMYDPAYDAVRDTYDMAVIAALGEGQINVCGQNGNIQKGDLIICSDMPGKGMKQPDDIVRGNTVARSRIDVTFDGPDDVRLIPCIYLCG